MNILINASNLKKGGGLQVADSVCCLLNKYPEHKFVVVLSHHLQSTFQKIKNYSNVYALIYDLPKTICQALFLRNKFLDGLVINNKIDVVLTIFGPALWKPRCIHVCGFARAHCVLIDSPYFRNLSYFNRLKEFIKRNIWIWSFNRCSDIYFTENESISLKLKDLFPKKNIYTVTNYYNQIFDNESKWSREIDTGSFSGTTILTISANYPHKNLGIIKEIVNYLVLKYPNFSFRFLLTISDIDLYPLTDVQREHIIFLGKVPIEECPNLYKQSDIVFLPSLLECFSANYPEAMKMKKPIITSDLDFAHSLCGDAAIYCSPLSNQSFGDAIFKLSTDNNLYSKMINNGSKQLLTYDNYEQRISKLINIATSNFII